MASPPSQEDIEAEVAGGKSPKMEMKLEAKWKVDCLGACGCGKELGF